MSESSNRFEQVARVVAVSLLVLGCFMVLRPFLGALMWAGIVCFSTWPVYAWLERQMSGKRCQLKAALVMMLLISLVLVAPVVMAGMALAENRDRIQEVLNTIVANGLPKSPAWLEKVPLVGESLAQIWTAAIANPKQAGTAAMRMAGDSSQWLLSFAGSLVMGVAVGAAQLCLSVLVMFFVYLNGGVIADYMRGAVQRLAGGRTQFLLDVVGGTVRGVVYGLVGTAFIQAVLATLGFWIAGVPHALFLGLLTFFLALLPMGPPLVWGPAAAWVIWGADRPVAGICLVVWGVLAISGVDNVLRPYLISKGNNMPFVLILFGVIGGVLSFGFIGLFLGPALLAIGYGLLGVWIQHKKQNVADSAPRPVAGA